MAIIGLIGVYEFIIGFFVSGINWTDTEKVLQFTSLENYSILHLLFGLEYTAVKAEDGWYGLIMVVLFFTGLMGLYGLFDMIDEFKKRP